MPSKSRWSIVAVLGTFAALHGYASTLILQATPPSVEAPYAVLARGD